ncbi:MAG: MgtC/SapB family protein [Candidatus Omnitrophica bacterium]|nr:MgtC/SapB family protein [Candidatus Omnitrophota bacterium]
MNWLTPQDTEMIARLILATLFGGFIGLEREIHGKMAGFRTHALVSIGAALIMLVSVNIYDVYKGEAQVDPSRIAAQVVSGIGFLGAGAIIRFPTGVKGLTTAASLWVAAGIGLACGVGFIKPALVTTVITLFVLWVFGVIGRRFGLTDV